MAETVDLRLLARLRAVLAECPVTEAELRALVEQADGWARALRGQVEASERRLERRAADPMSSLAELADELRRLKLLYPTLTEASTLHARLRSRARQLRTGWLLEQTTAAPALGARAEAGSARRALRLVEAATSTGSPRR